MEVASLPTTEVLSLATVIEPKGDPDGPGDIAILYLQTGIQGRGFIAFGDPDRAEEWHSVGFPVSEEYPAGSKEQSYGTVQGPRGEHDWIAADARSNVKIQPGFSGGAAWIPERKIAIGIVARYRDDGVAEVIPTDQLINFWPELAKFKDQAPAPANHLGNAGGYRKLEGQARPSIDHLRNIGRYRFYALFEPRSQEIFGQAVVPISGTMMTTAQVARRIAGSSAEAVSILEENRPRISVENSKVRFSDELTLHAFQIPGAGLLDLPTPDDLAGLQGRTCAAVVIEPSTLGEGKGFEPEEHVVHCKIGQKNSSAPSAFELQIEGGAPPLPKKAWDGAPVLSLLAPEHSTSSLVGFLRLVEDDAQTECFELLAVSCLRSCVEREVPSLLPQPTEGYRKNLQDTEDFIDELQKPTKQKGWKKLRQLQRLPVDSDEAALYLIQKLPMNRLAKLLAATYEYLVERLKSFAEADLIFQIAMAAIPASIRHSERVALPDRFSSKVWTAARREIYIELILAAAEDQMAKFEKLGSIPKEGELPVRSAFHVPLIGDVGLDYHATDGATEMAMTIQDQLARHMVSQSKVDQASMKQALDFLSTNRASEKIHWIFGGLPTDQRRVDSLSAQELEKICRAMNRHLQDPFTRSYYTIANRKNSRVLDVLSRHLSNFVIVEQSTVDQMEMESEVSASVEKMLKLRASTLQATESKRS